MATDATMLAGYWRWVSMHIEFADGGPNVDVYGSAPEGGVVFTPEGRIMALIATTGRQPANSDADRLALFRSFAAYTGRFRIEDGNRFVTEVDATWDPAWSGRQERFFPSAATPSPCGPPRRHTLPFPAAKSSWSASRDVGICEWATRRGHCAPPAAGLAFPY